MNYEDMHFTEEDKKRLQKNKEAIIKWIEVNIIPFLSSTDSYDRLMVEYGGMYISPRGFTKPVANYRIAIYGKEQNFYSGGGTTTKGKIGYGRCYGGIGQSLESVWSAWDIYPLVDNWSWIKNELQSQLGNRTRVSKQITEFVA